MTIDDATLERCAMALRQHVADRSGKGRPWTALPPSLQQQYRDEARIVLETALSGRCG